MPIKEKKISLLKSLFKTRKTILGELKQYYIALANFINNIALIQSKSEETSANISYCKILFFPVTLSSSEDFLKWFDYFSQHMWITEMKRNDKYSVWDIIEGDYLKPVSKSKVETSKASIALAIEKYIW